jgi:putative DNA primase/helicase
MGKSQITTAVAATISTGDRWPNGKKSRIRDVVLLSAEDSIERTVIPRLIAAGADMDRCHICRGDAATTERAVQLIEQLLDGLPNDGRGATVIVDPITCFVPNKNINDAGQIRTALKPFSQMGFRRKVTVIVIHHFRKGTEGSALEMVSGTGGFVQAARVVHGVYPHPRRQGWNLFLAIGNNIGAKHPGYAYQIVPETVNRGIETTRIAWHNDPVGMDADEALSLFATDPRLKRQ